MVYPQHTQPYAVLAKAVDAARVPTAFLVLPNFDSCLYNSIETRYMSIDVFYFLNINILTWTPMEPLPLYNEPLAPLSLFLSFPPVLCVLSSDFSLIFSTVTSFVSWPSAMFLGNQTSNLGNHPPRLGLDT